MLLIPPSVSTQKNMSKRDQAYYWLDADRNARLHHSVITSFTIELPFDLFMYLVMQNSCQMVIFIHWSLKVKSKSEIITKHLRWTWVSVTDQQAAHQLCFQCYTVNNSKRKTLLKMLEQHKLPFLLARDSHLIS